MSEKICSFQIGSSNFDRVTVDAYPDEICLSDLTDELWIDIADVQLLRETIENIQDGERLEPNWCSGKSIRISKDSECILIHSLDKNNAVVLDNSLIGEFVNNFRDYLGA